MRKTSAILAVAACASVATSAAPQKRYVRDPNQTVSGNELAYNITAPASSGGQAWTDAHARVVALVDEMTLDEKVSRAWEVGKQLGGHSLLMCDGTILCRSALLPVNSDLVLVKLPLLSVSESLRYVSKVGLASGPLGSNRYRN